MDKGKEPKPLPTLFNKLNLNINNNNTSDSNKLHIISPHKTKPAAPSLVSLCIAVIGKHIEDIIDDLADIASNFPSHIKMAIAAIARRRRLLNDTVVISLVESSWDILDISGSDVSDYGLSKVADRCKNIRAVDISRCSKVTSLGVSELLQHCDSLQILRWGGCPRSDHTARRCLGLLRPTLNHVDGESWEELDTAEIVHGASSLRWLVWPEIDKSSLETLSTECPRIIVNPTPSPFGYRGIDVPREASLTTVLDDCIVKDIDPKTWAVSGCTIKTSSSDATSLELPVAEKFRLAFLERDARLAPKRAKNARQHQRRAEREWVMTSTDAKAVALAAKASKTLYL